MFDKTWEWAGQFRRSEKNIGLSWVQIPEALKNLFDDVMYWLKNETFGVKEIAVTLAPQANVDPPIPEREW